MGTILKHKGKALVGAILFGIAVLGSAFISKTEDKTTVIKKEVKTTLTYEFWDFIGAPNPADNDPTDAEQYIKSSPGKVCTGSTKVCQIYAPADPSVLGTPRPDMNELAFGHSSSTVEQRINTALPSSTNETLKSYQN